ncbi:unnamed protein product [Allacma fusca]|uniref:Uncharacterized protein n=1 Tax=Allacma fusca TaxID=39272 RepID=A0A8J2JH93_9HEXA|nr:unnamed protein product [Allacma fusca]
MPRCLSINPPFPLFKRNHLHVCDQQALGLQGRRRQRPYDSLEQGPSFPFVCHVDHREFAHSSGVHPPFARSSVVHQPFLLIIGVVSKANLQRGTVFLKDFLLMVEDGRCLPRCFNFEEAQVQRARTRLPSRC